MAEQKPRFTETALYHIYNRGVEKRKIFLDDQDYLRFIHSLFEFNDVKPAVPTNQRFEISHPSKAKEIHLSQSLEVKPLKRREKLVEILIFTLMPNHFHLLIQQVRENGVVKFMQKIGTGFTMYFNQRYNRVGSLFQGTYKARVVARDTHFIHIPYYLHANPLDLKFPEWRKKEIGNCKRAMNFLENYRWSSFRDYIGIKSFPSVINKGLLTDFWGGPENYRKETKKWLKEMDSENLSETTKTLEL